MDSQRFLLVLALGLILFLIFQAWQDEQRQRAAPTAAPTAAPLATPEPPPPAATAPPSAPGTTPQPPTGAPPSAPTGQRITVVTDLIEAVIDTEGGDLRQIRLRRYPVAIDQPQVPVVLLNDARGELYVAQTGLIGRGPSEYPSHRTRYMAEAERHVLADGQEQIEVRLHWQAPSGVRYQKLYTFHRNRYLIDLSYLVENSTSAPWEGFLYREFVRHYVAPSRSWLALPTYTGGAIYTPQQKYQKIHFEDMSKQDLAVNFSTRQVNGKEERVLEGVRGGWVAILQHYFVGAWMPPAEGRSVFYTDVPASDHYVIGIKDRTATAVAPGASGRLTAQLYVGPKEHKRLRALAEGMELTVDFGWLTFISAPLFWLLTFLHDWIGNWGWAIVVLTVLIKVVFYPLSAASYKSMAHMKRVQPKMQSIRERFGHDKQRMNQAMMELYKKEKINPLGGCLPIAIQIPVFIALYWVLLESVELRQAPFVLWIRDLSDRDPYFVLPLIMGASMYVQQKLTPTQLDPMQQRIMMALPIVFTVFFLFFPAGLVLYWAINNILSIAQQWQITRMIEARAK